uniref:MAM domain-containing protein n=1 Tax=Timema cristinae TaxID=61476 RepID=A0A7R9H9E0_TIMCR|nr:unnamed protein product [Timema cristinae]
MVIYYLGPDTPMCLRFWTHMYGNGIGSLTVKLSDTRDGNDHEIWSLAGEAGNAWYQAEVPVSSSNPFMLLTQYLAILSWIQIMGLIPKCAKAETPDGWREVFEGARVKPNHFAVVSCEQTMFRKKKSSTPYLQEPEQLYHAPIPLTKEKCKDLKVLMKFCGDEGSKEYYSQFIEVHRSELLSARQGGDILDDHNDLFR